MKRIGERFRELPHIIIPQNKEIFEECEQKLDRFAFLHGGKIRSIVSYESFESHIYVELPFLSFTVKILNCLGLLRTIWIWFIFIQQKKAESVCR